MNTNEFYKELMSEFSFDHEKIKKAAMGKTDTTVKKCSRLKLKITAAAAAAAVVIAAGTVTAVSVLGNTGTPIVITPSSDMSAEERIRLALDAYKQMDELNAEEVFFYVTFEGEITPESMQRILSLADSTGKIKVVSVYRSFGAEVSGNDSITELFEYNECDITAVKIKCPGNLLKTISDLDEVFLVEKGEGFDDFSVILREEPDTSSSETSSVPEDPDPVSEPSSSETSETSADETSTSTQSDTSSESTEDSSSESSQPEPVTGDSAKELCFISNDTLAVICDNKIICKKLSDNVAASDETVFDLENASYICHGEGYALVEGADRTAVIVLDESGVPTFEEYNGIKAADAAYVGGKLVICDGSKLYSLEGGEAAEIASADRIVDTDGSCVVFTSTESVGFYNAEAETVRTRSGAAGEFAGGIYTVNVTAVDDESTLVLFCDAQGKEIAQTVLLCEEDSSVEAISADGAFVKLGDNVYSIADGELTPIAENTEVSFEKQIHNAFTSAIYKAEIIEGNVVINSISADTTSA